MRLLISGSSGLLGKELTSFLTSQGHQVVRLVRKSNSDSHTVFWDPENAEYNPADFEGFDAFINLSGENIASSRWSEAKKQKILESRVVAATTLCECIKHLKQPPKVLINASAVGYYGNQSNGIVTEKSAKGSGFLAYVCQAWEEAALKAKESGVRVVLLRIGTVITAQGGALGKMLLPFKLGLGGVIGSGEQYMSWIDIGDLVRIFAFALDHPLEGPVNATAPEPVTNQQFTKTLGSVLHRPTFLPMPEVLVHLIFGEMGDELLLGSIRAQPEKLIQAGYHFKYPHLKSSLEHALKF